MSHRQRDTHRVVFYHEVDTGETDRGGQPITEQAEYATAGVRLTDEGQPITQMRGGTVTSEEPIIACNDGSLLMGDPAVSEGHHVAIEGAIAEYDPADPQAGAWFEIQQVSTLYGRHKKPRGFEATLAEG